LYDLFRDFKLTLRRLARTPVFTLATLVTLALGIGANTAIFSVVNGVLLKPLPCIRPGLRMESGRQDNRVASLATVFWPLRSSSSMAFLLRSPRSGTDSFSGEIRQSVWAVSGGMAITAMETMKQIYDKSMSRTAFTLTLLAISGGMALLLAAVGIYAVISYTVAQRTREIGIRLALGAQQGALKMMFVRNGLLWGGIGAAAGLAAAVALSRLMSSWLFEISPFDPLTYSVVAMGLLAAAALASYLPARRVTRVDPVEALRAE